MAETLCAIASLDPMFGSVELICLWFDDVYFPCQERPECIATDVWVRGISEWHACFSDSELDALARFHSVFDMLLNGLSEDPKSFRNDPGWIKVAEAAKTAFNRISRRGPPTPLILKPLKAGPH